MALRTVSRQHRARGYVSGARNRPARLPGRTCRAGLGRGPGARDRGTGLLNRVSTRLGRPSPGVFQGGMRLVDPSLGRCSGVDRSRRKLDGCVQVARLRPAGRSRRRQDRRPWRTGSGPSRPRGARDGSSSGEGRPPARDSRRLRTRGRRGWPGDPSRPGPRSASALRGGLLPPLSRRQKASSRVDRRPGTEPVVPPSPRVRLGSRGGPPPRPASTCGG